MSEELIQLNQIVSGIPKVILIFSAPWCRPCQTLHPHAHRLAATYRGRVSIQTFGNSDSFPDDVLHTFGISGFPTVIVFYRGRVVERTTGCSPDQLQRMAARLSASE